MQLIVGLVYKVECSLVKSHVARHSEVWRIVNSQRKAENNVWYGQSKIHGIFCAL